MQLNPDDLVHIDRELASRSLSEFQRMAWQVLDPSQPYVHGWHTDAIAEHLEASFRGEIPRLLINLPPGTSKSTTVSVVFPAWIWGPAGSPGSRIIGASYEQGLASRDNRKTRLLIESEWFQRRWGIKLTSDQNEKTFFENEDRGWRQSCAVKSMTGKRGDVVIWDDPQSPEKAYSSVERETTIRVFRETLPLRLNNPDKSAIVIIQQRLHEDDISGHILKNEYGYEHLMIPMEFEPNRRIHTSIGWTDPRTEEGELLCTKRFPREVVERDKKAMGAYATAGQFQQRPMPRGGNLFHEEWWKYYREAPALQWRIIIADTAQKTKEQNDYSVFQCWGKSQSGQAVLLDQIRGKWEAPELKVQARGFWNKHKAIQASPLRAFKVEDKVSGTGLIQELKREGIPMLGIKRNTDKVTRAYDVAPFVESGNVLLPEDAVWLSDFLAECSAFPNGSHDDQVDPMMDAIAEILFARAEPRVRAL